MFKHTHAFSGFSVDNLAEAKDFYGRVLDLDVVETPEGIELHLAGGLRIFIYPVDEYTPAEDTLLNFVVDDIDEAIDELTERGVLMEQYDLPEIKTDERGIYRGTHGPAAIAWFKDPAGHILSVLQEKAMKR